MSALDQKEFARTVAELQMSTAFGAVCDLAANLPLDASDKDSLKTGLVTSSVSLVRALDRDAIRFDRKEDKAMLYGLLAVVMEVVFDGQFKARIEPVRLQ